MKQSIGVAVMLSASALAPLALSGCGDFRLPPPLGEGTGIPLTEYAEPIAGPSLTGPLAVLRSAVQPLPEVTRRDAAKVRLGRRLFHDPILSADRTVSCSSCHSLAQGGADGRRSSLGIRGQVGPINSPPVLSSAFQFVQFWDGRAADLREQAAGPVANPAEMGNTWENVVTTLGADTFYPDAFRVAYADGITAANVRDAIATYEETLVTPAPFDRWLKGDEHALNEEQRAGAELFVSTGCITCHQGVLLGGTSYQRMGAVQDYFAARATPRTDADNGRYNVTHNESDRHFFKVPTLRNVALTAPYLHDGTQQTLAETVTVMARYQLGRTLTEEQTSRIVAFLNALTGELPADARLPDGELPPPPAVITGPSVPGVAGAVAAPGAVRPAGGPVVRPAGAPVARPAAPAARPAAAAAAH